MAIGLFAEMSLLGFVLMSFAQMIERFDDQLTKINIHIQMENSLLLCGRVLAAEQNFLSASQNLARDFPESSEDLFDAFTDIALRLQTLDSFHGMNRDATTCRFDSGEPWYVGLSLQGRSAEQSENFVMALMKDEAI